MRKKFRFVAALTLSVALGGCAASPVRVGETNVTVTSANYTNDYIDFTLWSTSGTNLGMGGDAKPFANGGAGGTACCISIPGIGETIRVRARAGGFNDTTAHYKTYQNDVVIKGSKPTQSQLYSYLVVRFFSDHQIEAELIPSADFESKNPRVDQLFSGRRVMRRKGE